MFNTHNYRRFYQKISLFLRRMMKVSNVEIIVSSYETECILICKNLIKRNNSILLNSPISGKRYIKNDELELFIIIEQNQFTIVNHQYSYTVNIGHDSYNRILLIFDLEVEKRRTEMENEICSNIKNSLSNLHKKLSYDKI